MKTIVTQIRQKRLMDLSAVPLVGMTSVFVTETSKCIWQNY